MDLQSSLISTVFNALLMIATGFFVRFSNLPTDLKLALLGLIEVYLLVLLLWRYHTDRIARKRAIKKLLKAEAFVPPRPTANASH